MPTVSICIPTFEQTEYLRRTLDSIYVQDFKDYEIIISDDSKTNDVKALVDSYDFDGKLRYFRNEKSLGSPENWNAAVDKASGSLIKMLHHDDFFSYQDSLSRFVEVLTRDPNINFAFSASVVVGVNESKSWTHQPSSAQLNLLKTNPNCLFFGNFIGAPSATIYRNAKLRFDKKLKWVVDFDFYIRFLRAQKAFTFIGEPLITTISGAEHNVTNYCINNKDVELYEYLILYNKIKVYAMVFDIKSLCFFHKLLNKYKIKSLQEIRATGFDGQIPLFIRVILLLKRLKRYASL